MFPPYWAALMLIIALLIAAGGPLWAFLSHRPVSRRALVHAAWRFVGICVWVVIVSAAQKAHGLGLISLATCVVTIAGTLAACVGGDALLARYYPEATGQKSQR
jgi:hypothetical protein